ncbi:hypothetical protein APA_4060 [Pseudanabaena sp. lw0831]|uniref:hypothetical protein n=1 Tax=Pseudanabaena sp. lw0831 TaxID=1357935 RepID=UPI0019159590|nr:hypothetical protein [Pseudanabaena sp. lw0831]GBO51956.1 hypothetical protein APA_4060 [Pseudanabaena sp. lw0831]
MNNPAASGQGIEFFFTRITHTAERWGIYPLSLNKLLVNDRVQAAVLALRSGLVD